MKYKKRSKAFECTNKFALQLNSVVLFNAYIKLKINVVWDRCSPDFCPIYPCLHESIFLILDVIQSAVQILKHYIEWYQEQVL